MDQASCSTGHSSRTLAFYGRHPERKADALLIADAKPSTQPRYLVDARHKMRGYIADRPSAFEGSSPKAVVVCPVAGVQLPGGGDDVVFVGMDGGVVSARFEHALRSWWTLA